MKEHSNSDQVESVGESTPCKPESLDEFKRAALAASQSAHNEPVGDVRKEFGFMPADIQGIIIHWPKL